MELMAERWTEERLDDLKGQVERLEQRTDAGFRELREEMDRRFDGVDTRFDGIDRRFDGIDRRFETLEGRLYAMHRMLFLFLGSMVVATLSLTGTLIVSQL